MDPLALVDQEAAAIRDMLDEHPVFACAMREPSPWSHGARLVVVDCLTFRSDPERMLARMWAWNAMLEDAE